MRKQAPGVVAVEQEVVLATVTHGSCTFRVGDGLRPGRGVAITAVGAANRERPCVFDALRPMDAGEDDRPNAPRSRLGTRDAAGKTCDVAPATVEPAGRTLPS